MNLNSSHRWFEGRLPALSTSRVSTAFGCIAMCTVALVMACVSTAQTEPYRHSILEPPTGLEPPADQLPSSPPNPSAITPSAPTPMAPATVDPGSANGFSLPAFDDRPINPSNYQLLENREAFPRTNGTGAAVQPGQPAPRQLQNGGTSANQEDQVDINRLLTRLVLDAMPPSYVDEDDWGGQEEVFDGWEVEREGLRIETRRKRKMVNHGTWKMYSAELINPEEEFQVEVVNLRRTDNGDTGFDVHFYAHLDLHARQSKWVRGVQLYSLSADGHARVKLVVSCEMGVAMDVTRFPPDMVFDPEVTSAEIIVEDFRIERVSKLGGEFAQQVSRQVRRILDDKIEEREERLVEKINEELEENSDKLRLSIADAIQSQWSEPAREFLPESIQQAMEEAGR
ncbi:MAG: hypothetical protein AAF456_00930 [Planctomycetota bacterium]